MAKDSATQFEAELKQARDELQNLEELYAQLTDRLDGARRHVETCEAAVDKAKEQAAGAHTVASAKSAAPPSPERNRSATLCNVSLLVTV